MSALDADRYLRRIGVDRPTAPTAGALAELQLGHLLHVPFENLHVFFRRGVDVDLTWSVPKIVERGRGGWCFELNGAFGALLTELGYDVTLLSCRTFNPDTGALSDPFDHLALLVVAEGQRYLVDVGWGDNALTPIPAEAGEHDARPRPVRIERTPDALRLVELITRVDGETVWELQFEASLVPHALEDFRPRSTYLQTEPGLMWTEKPLVTQARSPRGARVTLHRDRLTVRDDELRSTSTPVGEDEWGATLVEAFGLDVP